MTSTARLSPRFSAIAAAFALAFAFALAGGAPAQAVAQAVAQAPVTAAPGTAMMPARAETAALVDSVARAYFNSQRAPGIAVAVVRGSDTLLMRGYGLADRAAGRAVTPSTVFRLGSLTKQFTSAVVLQLADEGKFSLDDSIGAHVRDLPAPMRGAAVRHLLNHTSGVANFTAVPAYVGTWRRTLNGYDIVALVADKPLDFAPGSAFRYSNTGYVLLGMLIESATGQTWHEAVTQRFGARLGVHSLRACPTTPTPATDALGYEPAGADGAWADTPFLDMSIPHAAGALCATAPDFVTWQRALHGGRVLPAASYARMTTPEGAGGRYGFGINREALGGRTVFIHTGGVNGFSTVALRVPDADLDVVVLTNSGAADPARLAGLLAQAALGIPLPVIPPTLPLAAVDRDRYVGTYGFGPARLPFHIRADGARITSQLQGQGVIPLNHLGNHTFGADFDPNVRITFTIVDGQAVKFTLLQGGRTMEAVRIP